jgi:Cys-rich peptide (Clo7bot family)
MKFVKDPARRYVLGYCLVCGTNCDNRCQEQCVVVAPKTA